MLHALIPNPQFESECSQQILGITMFFHILAVNLDVGSHKNAIYSRAHSLRCQSATEDEVHKGMEYLVQFVHFSIMVSDFFMKLYGEIATIGLGISVKIRLDLFTENGNANLNFCDFRNVLIFHIFYLGS
jgi:hypothetical protein